ncbi:efflux RND transporter periplasmic adaptor subunit [Variovorax terrae]|uniref:Efflux RND transporter periplasmic adaptor subunit n=1 Tax=Variovorax terrae TaxID=2923278 RepID=A0A9X2ANP6_9BURK|nr:efflux RND transporter periplasmic adaptor subunit [Variovorax terrae]MCJ0765063.1 efflux RND transporter periplasmic adaptor subunit [Variovorax terrae]
MTFEPSTRSAAGWLLAAACTVLAGCDGARGLPGSSTAEEPARPSAAAVVHEAGSVFVPEASPLRQSLQLAAVQVQAVERPIGVPAAIEADPARLVRIVPPLAGRIVRLHKMLGDPVQAGDLLLTLDSADLSAAHSDATKAQAALGLARKNLARQQELAQAEIAAQKDLEQAQSDFAQAESEARRARTRLAQLGAAPGAGSAREYVLRAPISGRVIELAGAAGGYWNDTNAPVMTVADLSSVWLAASVSERDLASVFVGQKARIELNAYEGQAFEGTVRYVGEVLDADTRTVKVRVAVDNRAGRFRPGMFARAVFSGPAHQAVVVPASALVQSGLYTRVFVEKAPFRFEPRVVKAGAVLGDRVEIVSGLQAGERIVVKEGVLLND